MSSADVVELVAMQEDGAVAGLSNVFPQDEHPFPRSVIEARWRDELRNPRVTAYVATTGAGEIVGFAARRDDELLHFGTSVATWGSGLATWLHDKLIATYPPDLTTLRLRVFAQNARARRFYERLGWTATGRESRTSFPPHPTLIEYVLVRSEPPPAT
jgi:RimJ/RimL family protein N-acetyltransferase